VDIEAVYYRVTPERFARLLAAPEAVWFFWDAYYGLLFDSDYGLP
jgi:hypothetical protein